MESQDYIKFLGTAGARFAVARQLRSSAGAFLRIGNKNIVLDPGPGTLVRLADAKPRLDVTQLDAIILTHAHIDHSNDVNVLIDGMTDGGLKKRGVLFAPQECISGENAVVLKYLRGFLQDIVILREKTRCHLGDLAFDTSVRHEHGVETYGLMFQLEHTKVSFMVDTKYFPGLLESYRGSDVLVMNVVLKASHPRIKHLSLEDVKQVLQELRPRQAILTHFGMPVLEDKPWELAAQLTQELGMNVLAADDGMTVQLK